MEIVLPPGVRQTQTADLQTADLQTCRPADLQTRSELTGGGIIVPAGISPRGRNPEEAL